MCKSKHSFKPRQISGESRKDLTMAEKVTVRTQPEDTRPQVRFVVLTQTTTDVRKHLNVADAPELIAWESAPRSTGIVQPVERKGTHSTVFVPVVLNPRPLRPKRDPTRIQGGIRRRHHLRRTLPSSPAPADQHRRHHHADKSDHSTTRDPSPRDRATRQRKISDGARWRFSNALFPEAHIRVQSVSFLPQK